MSRVVSLRCAPTDRHKFARDTLLNIGVCQGPQTLPSMKYAFFRGKAKNQPQVGRNQHTLPAIPAVSFYTKADSTDRPAYSPQQTHSMICWRLDRSPLIDRRAESSKRPDPPNSFLTGHPATDQPCQGETLHTHTPPDHQT